MNQPTKLILLTENCYVCHPKKVKSVIAGKKAIVSKCCYFFTKSSSRNSDIDFEPYVDFYKETDHYSFRHNDKPLTLKMRYARTNVFKCTYFHKAEETGNSIPLSIREATRVISFKALVKFFFYGLLIFFNVSFVIIFNIYCYHN